MKFVSIIIIRAEMSAQVSAQSCAWRLSMDIGSRHLPRYCESGGLCGDNQAQ